MKTVYVLTMVDPFTSEVPAYAFETEESLTEALLDIQDNSIETYGDDRLMNLLGIAYIEGLDE